MRRVAGVSPQKLRLLRKARKPRSARKAGASTWGAALSLALVAILAALYAGDRASRHFDLDLDAAAPVARAPVPPVAAVAPEPAQVPNRAKKQARETVKGASQAAHLPPGHWARPESWQIIDPSQVGAAPDAPLDDAAGDFALEPPAPADEEGLAETGHASWYQLASMTASGERMEAGALTAAHRSLPLGSYARVENLDNGRVVLVRINDRGPFTKGRIIDLSKAAAKRLGMIDDGVAKVRVTPAAEGEMSAALKEIAAEGEEIAP